MREQDRRFSHSFRPQAAEALLPKCGVVAIHDATINWAAGQIFEIRRAHTWRTTESSACSIETAAPLLTMRDNSMTRPFASILAVAVCLAGSSSGHQLNTKDPAPACKSIEGSWSGTWGGGSDAESDWR